MMGWNEIELHLPYLKRNNKLIMGEDDEGIYFNIPCFKPDRQIKLQSELHILLVLHLGRLPNFYQPLLIYKVLSTGKVNQKVLP